MRWGVRFVGGMIFRMGRLRAGAGRGMIIARTAGKAGEGGRLGNVVEITRVMRGMKSCCYVEESRI